MSAHPLVRIAPSFNGKIDRSAGPSGCWPWTGSLTTNGYGQTRVWMDGRWRSAGAHQVAHYLKTGRWEKKAEGRLVRHLCHNRPCCNGAHLRGGTPLDNAADRHSRVLGAPSRDGWMCFPVVGVANRGVAA